MCELHPLFLCDLQWSKDWGCVHESQYVFFYVLLNMSILRHWGVCVDLAGRFGLLNDPAPHRVTSGFLCALSNDLVFWMGSRAFVTKAPEKRRAFSIHPSFRPPCSVCGFEGLRLLALNTKKFVPSGLETCTVCMRYAFVCVIREQKNNKPQKQKKIYVRLNIIV